MGVLSAVRAFFGVYEKRSPEEVLLKRSIEEKQTELNKILNRLIVEARLVQRRGL